MKFIILLILSLLMVPFSKNGYVKEQRRSREESKPKLSFVWLAPIAVFWGYVGFTEYFSLADNNVGSIITYYAIALAILFVSSIFVQNNATRVETIVKLSIAGILFFSSIYFSFVHEYLSRQAKYDSVVVEHKESSEVFTEDDTPFLVPSKTAANKMKKVFADVPNVSYYELGEITPQWVNGEAIYVAPVEISSFFKAFKSKHVPAYITMSGTDPNAEAELHLGYKMKYVPSEIGKHHLQRLVRKSEPNLIFHGDPKFEIDDKGNPFYTMTYGTFVSGRSGFIPEGVVLIDPQTGEIERFNKGDQPNFLDGTLNEETASTLDTYFGEFVEGAFNFSDTNVKLPSDDVKPIFGKDGKMYFFTDYTSPKEGVDSALGYSLLDAETGVLTYYSGGKLKGMMDSSAAIKAVNNKFKKEVWEGTMPVIYNVYDKPSWVLPVVDADGLVQAYAVVSASNANVIATGTTQRAAFQKYKSVISQKKATLKPSSKGEEKSIIGKVVAKEVLQEAENKMVYLLLEGREEIFVITGDDFPYSIFAKEGETVTMSYLDSGEVAVAVIDYKAANLQK